MANPFTDNPFIIYFSIHSAMFNCLLPNGYNTYCSESGKVCDKFCKMSWVFDVI